MTRLDDAVYADDGCRLWVAEEGRGRPLMCCHGGPGLWDMFGSFAGLLGGQVRVIRWDQRSANCCGITCTGINVDRYSPRKGLAVHVNLILKTVGRTRQVSKAAGLAHRWQTSDRGTT